MLSVCFTSLYIIYKKYFIQLKQQGFAFLHCKWDHNIVVLFFVYVVMKTIYIFFLRAEIFVRIIRRKPIVKYIFKSLHVIFVDKLGQFSAE